MIKYRLTPTPPRVAIDPPEWGLMNLDDRRKQIDYQFSQAIIEADSDLERSTKQATSLYARGEKPPMSLDTLEKRWDLNHRFIIHQWQEAIDDLGLTGNKLEAIRYINDLFDSKSASSMKDFHATMEFLGPGATEADKTELRRVFAEEVLGVMAMNRMAIIARIKRGEIMLDEVIL